MTHDFILYVAKTQSESQAESDTYCILETEHRGARGRWTEDGAARHLLMNSTNPIARSGSNLVRIICVQTAWNVHAIFDTVVITRSTRTVLSTYSY